MLAGWLAATYISGTGRPWIVQKTLESSPEQKKIMFEVCGEVEGFYSTIFVKLCSLKNENCIWFLQSCLNLF